MSTWKHTQNYLTMVDHRDHTVLNSQNLSGLTKTAQTWMNSCKCASFWEEPGAKWYPRRLLDLQELRASPDPHQTRIRLIESRNFIIGEETCSMSGFLPSKHQNDRYVTLSHCWGNPKLGSLPPLSMTFKNEKRFKTEGIIVKELPKTFRDAVVFAAGLDKVGFIWIDSLCIRQPIKGDGENEEDQLQDWFEQTRHMGNLYRKAFLNISATAAYDVKGGLFFEPCPELLRENNIDVYYPEDPDTTLENGVEKTNPYARCSLIDPSAWDDLVENAPVNQRAWVFQERLLAPRVLHFGYNQLAWECHKFNSSESYSWSELAMKPSSTPGFTDRSCLKHLTVSAGRSFREARIGDFRDCDTQIKDIYIYGLWKKIVESYSRTKLTEHYDKLTALGGIAKLFHDELFSPDHSQTYVAGLWSGHIESQLLWTVNAVYRGNSTYENLGQPGKRTLMVLGLHHHSTWDSLQRHHRLRLAGRPMHQVSLLQSHIPHPLSRRPKQPLRHANIRSYTPRSRPPSRHQSHTAPQRQPHTLYVAPKIQLRIQISAPHPQHPSRCLNFRHRHL